MSARNFFLCLVFLGLILGFVAIGSTKAKNELTKDEELLKDWSSSEDVPSSSSSSSSSLSSSDNGFRVRRSAIDNKAQLWPDGEIPYVISDGMNSALKPRIMEAIEHYHQTTCVRFLNGTAEEFERNRMTVEKVERNFVQFTPGEDKFLCSSPVGMLMGRRPLQIILGITCQLEAIVHEIGHLLGLLHEQSRADRDANVIIQWSDIRGNMKNNFEKSKSMQLLGPYDLSSVMHYIPQTFSANHKPVYTLINDPNVQPQDRRELSFYDALKLNKLYQCADHCDVTSKTTTTTTTRCENGGYLDKFCQCVCPASLTGQRCHLPITSPKCGRIIELKGAKRTITSLNFPRHYPPNINCTWLIKAPVRSQILLSLDEFDIGCKDSLEIRYHYIGIELRSRSCYESTELQQQKTRTLTSTTNLMIVNFRSNSADDDRRSGFRAAVKAVPSQDCASNPCQQNATCRDVADIETYLCECPDGWIGKDCELQVKDGEWSSWSPWTGCTAACGYENRSRECASPPLNGGSDCQGVRKETRRCSTEHARCQGLFHCDFGVEPNHTTCGIVQDSVTDEFDWRTQSLATGSQRSRMAGHTTSDPDDVFFHMEGNDGQTLHNAIFWLPHPLASIGRYCLQFYYHMPGMWTGMLRVVRVTRRSSRVIWQTSGLRSNAWRPASINVILYDAVKIGFFGIRGDGADSDIAVDDISLSPGGCYVTHFGQKVLRVPKIDRPLPEFYRSPCVRDGLRYRVGSVFIVEGCSQFACHCNHNGALDCPSWEVKDICTKSTTPS